MRRRDKEWFVYVISSSSLRERDEIDAKSTSDVNMIEVKKKRNDNDKTMKDSYTKIILIAELSESRVKEMINVLDQLIKTSRVTRTNDASSVFKSIKTIKKLKEMTTRLKKIAKKKKTYEKKSNTWATIAWRDIVMIKSNIDAKKTSIFFSKRELEITIKTNRAKEDSNDTKNDIEKDCEENARYRRETEFAKEYTDNIILL